MWQRLRGPILVVEDNTDLRESVVEILTRKGYLARGAENGKAAVDELEQSRTPPVLILLDLEMPVMDGMTFLRRVKQISRFKGIPVLLMTAQEKPPATEALGLLSKPFTLSSLLSLVEQGLASRAEGDAAN